MFGLDIQQEKTNGSLKVLTWQLNQKTASQ